MPLRTPSEPVRELYVGLQAAAGTPAATLVVLPVTDVPAHKLDRDPDIVEEIFGTLVRANRNLRTGQFDGLTIKKHPHYDLDGYLLRPIFGSITSSGVSGATGAFDHNLKEAATPMLLTCYFDDGKDWWRMIDVVVEQAKWTIPTRKPPVLDVELKGPIATRTNPADSPALVVAAYNHPDWAQWLVKLGGASYNYGLSGSMMIKRNREPFFTGRRNVDPVRFSESGGVQIEGDVLIDPHGAGYVGSMLEDYINNTGPGSIEFEWIDTATSIGTGTPTTPQYSLVVPKPRIKNAGHDFARSVTTPIKFQALYSASDGAGMKARIRNEIATYAGS